MWMFLLLLLLVPSSLFSLDSLEDHPKEIILTWDEYQQVRSLLNQLQQQLGTARQQLAIASTQLEKSQASLIELKNGLEAEQGSATTRDTIRRIGAGVTLLGICASVVGIIAPQVIPPGIMLAIGGVTLSTAVFTVAWSP